VHRLTLDEVEDLARSTLIAAGASAEAAGAVARSTRLAERDGIRSHGLLYLPFYAEHVRCGKVAGDAVPVVEQTRPGSLRVDAAHGFAHAAIDAGWPAFTAAARACGIAAMSLHRSYNCGVLGHHAARLAEDGLVGLCMTHAPASIAPVGGKRPVIGTNPIALAVPDGAGGTRLVIDQSASVVAKSEILLRSKSGAAIEPPTTSMPGTAETGRLWCRASTCAAANRASCRTAMARFRPTFPLAPVIKSFIAPHPNRPSIIVY